MNELERAWRKQHNEELRRIRAALVQDARNGVPEAIEACIRQNIDYQAPLGIRPRLGGDEAPHLIDTTG